MGNTISHSKRCVAESILSTLIKWKYLQKNEEKNISRFLFRGFIQGIELKENLMRFEMDAHYTEHSVFFKFAVFVFEI